MNRLAQEPTLDLRGGLCHITSPENGLVVLLKGLTTRKGRERSGLFLAEGIRSCREALRAVGEQAETAAPGAVIAIADSFLEGKHRRDESRVLLDEAAGICGMGYAIRLVGLKDSLFAGISDTVHSQGVLMAVPAAMVLRHAMPWNPRGLYLLLDRLQDPGNLGTLIRTAHAAGVHGIALVKGSVDPFNPKVVRATMGSLFRVAIAFYDTSAEAVADFNLHGIRVLTASAEASEVAPAGNMSAYTGRDLTGGVAIGIGNEGEGAGEALLKEGDGGVFIPMPGGAESLNAAVAGSILVFEALRQRTARRTGEGGGDSEGGG